jgi:sterol 14-demethylase
MSLSTGLREPRRVSGGEGTAGHLEELRVDPIGLLSRVRRECGDVGAFRLASRNVVLLTGAPANEFFFRAPEDDLDQAEAYPFMTPIFGEGVVFDASPERRREMLHNQALRDKFMRGHAETIAGEVDAMLAAWGGSGEIDLLDWFAELTIYTSSACLIGKRFRRELDRRFSVLYHDLERGTDALAYVDPYAPIESFQRRDAARLGLVALVQAVMDRRAGEGTAGPEAERDLLDVLMSIRQPDGSLRFSADEITGMFISMMFAGHHTTSGTAAWTLIELLRHPGELAAVVAELDALAASGAEVSYQALREMPRLEAALKETLRLHPPLILLLRVAKRDLCYAGCHIAAGDLVAASPAVSNRIAEDFPAPDQFLPERYLEPRAEDRTNPWTWIPFGAGRHRCVGAPFAVMQLKAIFSVLLKDWSFELAQPPETYRNDHSKMVVQLATPCAVFYSRRSGGTAEAEAVDGGARTGSPTDANQGAGAHRPGPRILVDHDLCQGHAVCESEAPGIFSVPKHGKVNVLLAHPAAGQLDAVRRAVSFCPTNAICLEEES